MRPIKNLLCQRCGRPIIRSGAYKYCSNECMTAATYETRREAYKKVGFNNYSKTVTCPECGVEFVAPHPSVKYCEIHRGHGNRSRTPRSAAPLTCPVCGKTEIRKAGSKTCSDNKCRNAYKAKLQKERYNRLGITSPRQPIAEKARYKCVSAPESDRDCIGEVLSGAMLKASLKTATLPAGSIYANGREKFRVVGDPAPFEACIRGYNVSPQKLERVTGVKK